MRVTCAKSAAKLVHIGEQLDSLMVQPESTLQHQIIPLQVCMDGTSRVVGSSLPIGEREAEPPSQVSDVDLDSGMRRSELHRIQQPRVEIGWREILSWYSVEQTMDEGEVSRRDLTGDALRHTKGCNDFLPFSQEQIEDGGHLRMDNISHACDGHPLSHTHHDGRFLPTTY